VKRDLNAQPLYFYSMYLATDISQNYVLLTQINCNDGNLVDIMSL
jgi:hypothetical protein